MIFVELESSDEEEEFIVNVEVIEVKVNVGYGKGKDDFFRNKMGVNEERVFIFNFSLDEKVYEIVNNGVDGGIDLCLGFMD